MKKTLIGLSGLTAVFLPMVAFAQGGCGGTGNVPGTIEGMICKIGDILSIIIPILIVLGVLYFVWGVVQYVISDDEEAKTKGRDRMIYGIIGLVVIVAMWGLVRLVISTFSLDADNTPLPPPGVQY